MNQCYYCKTEADLVLNNRAMVCPLCNDIKGALSLQDFDTHAYLAFNAGQYTLQQFKNVSSTIKALTVLRRKLSAKKGQITRIANDTGWRERYKELCVKATGKEPTVYPDATYTPDIEKFIKNFINWQGGNVRKRNTEGQARNFRETEKVRRLWNCITFQIQHREQPLKMHYTGDLQARLSYCFLT